MRSFERTLGSVALMAAGCALLWSGCASGPYGVRPEIRNVGDGGEGREEITIQFEIFDEDLTRPSVALEYHYGGTWHEATLTGATVAATDARFTGNVVVIDCAVADWTACTATWDTLADGVALDGSQTVTIRLTPRDFDGEGEPAEHQVTVNNHYAALEVSETSIDFGERLARVPEKLVQNETLDISNGTGAYGTTLHWEITDIHYDDAGYEDWLVPGAWSGDVTTVPYSLTLTADVDGAGLVERAAPYTAKLTITGKDTDAGGADAFHTPRYVAVSVTVRDPETEIFLHDGGGSEPPDLAEFVCVEGGTPSPASQSFWVMNAGDEGSVLVWSAVDNLTSPDWLVGFDGATTGEINEGDSTEVTVAVDATGVAPGDYSGVITVAGTEKESGDPARGGSKTVPVSLSVLRRAEIGCATSDLGFALYLGEDNPDPQTLTITNPGDSALDWTATDDASNPYDWLTVTSPGSVPAGGASDITVSVDASGIATADTYEADITITGTDGTDFQAATGSPKTMHVTLIVRDNTPVLWHLDIPIAGTWGGHTGEVYTGTHRVATFGDDTATINFMEITYTDDDGGGGRNYDALGLVHTSSQVDRTSNYCGKIGAWQIGRNTGGYPPVMTFYARYDFDTGVFEISTPGVGTSETHDRSPLTFGPGRPLYARCWYHRGDGWDIPVVSDIRILVNVTCVRMPGAVMESLTPGAGSNTLTWRPSPATEAVAQKLYRATSDEGPWSLVQSFAENTTSQYTDTDVSAGQTYFYIVIAEAAGGLPGAGSNIIPDTVTGLVAHWKFDEGAGQTAADSSGNGNDGTLGSTGGVDTNDPAWVAGKVGTGALSFSGAPYDDYVNIGASDVVPPWTAAMWVKREDCPNSASRLMDSSAGSLRLEQSIHTNKVGITRYTVYDHAFNYEAPVGAWVHLAFVGTGSGTELYVNGVPQDTTTRVLNAPMAKIGNDAESASGSLDDVRVYDRALSDAEIQAIYNLAP